MAKKGGYRATRRDKKYLKLYKQGKSIGFTMRASLKAKGLIPRANGTRRVSKKYKGGEKPPLPPRSVGSVGSSGSSGFRSFSQKAVNIGNRNIKKAFAGLNLNAANEENAQSRCEKSTGKGFGCPCTKGSSNGFFKKLSGSTECGPATTCAYDESNSIEYGEPRYTCQYTAR